MSWTLLAIRELDDGDTGVLYPIPTDAVNGIEKDDADGSFMAPISVTGIELYEQLPGEKRTLLLKAQEIKASLYISDSRIAVACTKYDKGGGWVGGLSAVALNAASKARAAVRRKGKSLVGHVRYPWLNTVGYMERSGWGTSEQIRLIATERTGSAKTNYYLDLSLPKTTSAKLVATEIAQRAAKYRLAHTKVNPEERPRIESLLNPPPLTQEKNRFAMWSFPTYFFVRTSTAFGDLTEGDASSSAVSPEPAPLPTPEPAPLPPPTVGPIDPTEPVAVEPAPAPLPTPTVGPIDSIEPVAAEPAPAPVIVEPEPSLITVVPTAGPTTPVPAADVPNPPRWVADPLGRHELRFWDGAAWTQHVSDNAVTSTDPPAP